MPKIALIQPEKDAGKSLGIKKSPESIQILASQLEKAGYEIKMFHEKPGEKLYHELAEFFPDYVGLSSMTSNFPDAEKIAKEIKEQIQKPNHKIPIILGGWHASGCAKAYSTCQETESLREILNPKSPFDFAVAGEGDVVLLELIARLEQSNVEAAKKINGVCYLESDDKIHVSFADRVDNLDALDDPSWKGLDISKYRDMRNNNLDLSVHFNRACRFACGFCATQTVYGRGVKTFSPERAVNYITCLLERFHPNVITFTDEDFFAKLDWVEKVVALIYTKGLAKKYNVIFDTFASINDLYNLEKMNRGNLLDKMVQAGFGSFTIGIESLNANTLHRYNKLLMILPTMSTQEKIKYQSAKDQQQKDELLVEQHRRCAQAAINFAQQHGIIVVGDYIIGNLGENEQEVRTGFARFNSLNGLYAAYIPLFTPFPGTILWSEAYNSGKLRRTKKGNIDWSKFDASEGALDLGYDVESLRNQLELEFYTSERYKLDMKEVLLKKPELNKFFKNRFNYLNKRFPKNPLVLQRLEELK